MSYGGKFVGQYVGSWLGSIESDPNALNAGLSGAGDLSAELSFTTSPSEPPIVIGPVGRYASPGPTRRWSEERDEEAVLVAILMH